MLIETIGYLAGISTACTGIPQIFLLLKKKQSDQISLSKYVLLTTGLTLWVLYGILIEAWPIVITNILSLIITGITVKLIYKYR